jgi:hypothetical protein
LFHSANSVSTLVDADSVCDGLQAARETVATAAKTRAEKGTAVLVAVSFWNGSNKGLSDIEQPEATRVSRGPMLHELRERAEGEAVEIRCPRKPARGAGPNHVA